MISNHIGVMQGRLSKPIGNRIQAYPVDSWREEFQIASNLGINSIEWIVEEPLNCNSLMSDSGVNEILSAIESSGVRVNFICADIFMERPLFDFNQEGLDQKSMLLNEIIKIARRVGAKCVEIPFVDNSSLDDSQKILNTVKVLKKSLDYASEIDMLVALETDLDPDKQVELVELISHPFLRLNYDIGNSASLGYDPIVELDAYGELVENVHIKDRHLGGSTVPLGEGSADIPKVLNHLSKIGYTGDFTLQAARKKDDVEAVKCYLEQVKNWIAQINGEQN